MNRFYLMVKDAVTGGMSSHSLRAFLREVKAASHLLWGITDVTMSHGEGWHFARLGRLLERADKTSRILDVKYFILLPIADEVGTPFDMLQWSHLLKSAIALEMYYKRYGRIAPDDVAAFLILDPTFPRAIRYCLIKSEDSLHVISGSERGSYQNTAEKRLGRLRAELDFVDIEDFVTRGLHEFVDDFQTRLNRVGEAIFETFFAPRRVHSIQSIPEGQ